MNDPQTKDELVAAIREVRAAPGVSQAIVAPTEVWCELFGELAGLRVNEKLAQADARLLKELLRRLTWQ